MSLRKSFLALLIICSASNVIKAQSWGNAASANKPVFYLVETAPEVNLLCLIAQNPKRCPWSVRKCKSHKGKIVTPEIALGVSSAFLFYLL
jgi:hypothetical protein